MFKHQAIRNQIMMLEQLPALYEQASSLNYKLDNSSEDWFNPDIPSEESFPWTADDLVLSEDVELRGSVTKNHQTAIHPLLNGPSQ